MTKKEKLERDWKEFNRWLKSQKEGPITLPQYERYLVGKGLPGNKRRAKSTNKIPKYEIPLDRNPYTLPSCATTDIPKEATSKRDPTERQEISKNYTVAPVCNKGGYQVIRKDEVKTAGRKV